MIEQLGGRKAIGAALTVLIAVGVVVFMHGDLPANFEHLLEIVFGTFVAGNAANTISAHINGASESTETVESAPIPVVAAPSTELQVFDTLTDCFKTNNEKLDRIAAQNETITQVLNTSQEGIKFLVAYVAQQQQAVSAQSVATQAAANRAALGE